MEHFVDIWQYMPHGMCLLWQPWLVLLWAGSDVLIFLAYMAIPLALLRVVRARNDLQHRGLIFLFAGFILLCGLTHLLGAVTLWWPIYPYVGLVKLATGLVSAVTAIVLMRLVPTLIALPSQADLEAVNRQLREKIAAHEAAEAELQAIRVALEGKVRARTAELEQANAKMAVIAREAVHRSKNLLAVVGSIARQSARGHDDIDTYVSVLLGRIHALAAATATVIGRDDASSATLAELVEQQMTHFRSEETEDRIRIEGPEIAVSSEAAQQIGLAIHELATNSQKYGALSEPEGEVHVHWRRDATGTEERFVFTWEETAREGLAETSPATTGFGHTLLTRVVPMMLQGTATREIAEQRLRYTLAFPLNALATDTTSEGDATLAARIVDENFGIA